MPPTRPLAKPLSLGGCVGWGLGVLWAALGGACSTADAPPELVSEAQFPERFAQVWCQSVAPCCADRAAAYDPALCQSQARDSAHGLLANRQGGDSKYSAHAGSLCLDRLARALGSCELEEASTACGMIFVGPSPDGTPCSNGSACASGYCALGEAALSGVCAEASYRSPSHGHAGEPCVGSCGVPGSFECPTSLLPGSDGTTTYCYAEDGLYCSLDSESLDALRCRPYAAIGASCADVNCLPGSFCSEGVCVAQQASGACTDTPDRCLAQSYCDTSQRCQLRKPIAGECLSGEECASHSCTSDGRSSGSCDSGNTLLARACSGAP